VRRHLSGIFTPVIEEIDRLVGEQISKVQIKRMSQKHPKGDKIKAIFLVGGFGSSLYLKGSIAAAHPGIHIVQPNDA
jgi:hypothetical protein